MNLTQHICEAETFGPWRACGRCQLVWDAAGDKPGCKEKADPPISLGRMAQVLEAAARYEEQGQAARVKTGDRDKPHMETLYDAAVMRAAARVLLAIDGDDQAKRRLTELSRARAG